MTTIKVELVKQLANNGRYARMTTRVTIDGRSVTFLERLPKRLAIEAARRELARG